MALQKARKDSNSTPFKFLNAGDSIKGYYQGQVTKTINGLPAVEHIYKTPTGVVGVLGQANILNQIKNNGITPGMYVEITFSGQMQRLKNGRTMKVYDVSFDPNDLDSDVSAPVDNTEEYGDEEDEAEPALERPSKPAVAAQAPTPARQAQVQALLNKAKASR
jgi:hypothetical protein